MSGLKADLAALKVRAALLRLMLKQNFNPAQPRVPAGNTEGGRWTYANGLGGNGRQQPGVSKLRLRKPVTKRFDGLPAGSLTLKAPDGTYFHAPASADFEKVFQAGKAMVQQPQEKWKNYIDSQVGQFGAFDFQRNDGIFYSQYTDASNYAAGLFMNGAGFSYQQTMIFAGGYAATHSKGGVTARRARWWTYGYLAGEIRSRLAPLPGSGH